MEDFHVLECDIVDDGVFEIPAQVLALVPAGYFFSGGVTSLNSAIVQVTADTRVRIIAGVCAQFEYQLQSR